MQIIGVEDEHLTLVRTNSIDSPSRLCLSDRSNIVTNNIGESSVSVSAKEYVPQLNIGRTIKQIPGLSNNALVWLHEHMSREIDKRNLSK